MESPLQSALTNMPLRDARTATALVERLEQFERWKAAPWDYIEQRLGVNRDTFDWQRLPQYEHHRWDGTKNPLMSMLEGLAKGEWVGVESATGVGKTFIAACITFWFLECFESSLVVTTAPKEKQLELHVWKEIGKIHQRVSVGELQSLRLRMEKDRNEWMAEGFVAGYEAGEESATRAQGFHAEHMLIICEEMPGIPQPILTALQNTCTAPHNLILGLGNPDHQLDTLHSFCSQSHVRRIRISALDHPNIVLKKPLFVPGAQTDAGLQRMLNRYGSTDNPMYMSRAQGISPAQSVDALIRLEWCYAAANRYDQFRNETGAVEPERVMGEYALGVDVANSTDGDKGALALGRGNVLLSVKDFPCPDSNQLGVVVDQMMSDNSIVDEHCAVDGVGVGAGTVNKLKELSRFVMNLNGGPIETQDEEQFVSLRAQMWWAMREALRKGEIALPRDEDLFADLVTPKWTVRSQKIVVESKEELKKRLGHSPDKGDAAVYWNWVRADRLLTLSDLRGVRIESLTTERSIVGYL